MGTAMVMSGDHLLVTTSRIINGHRWAGAVLVLALDEAGVWQQVQVIEDVDLAVHNRGLGPEIMAGGEQVIMSTGTCLHASTMDLLS